VALLPDQSGIPSDVAQALENPIGAGPAAELARTDGLLPIEHAFVSEFVRTRDPGIAMAEALRQVEGAARFKLMRRSERALRCGGQAMLRRKSVSQLMERLEAETRAHMALDQEFFITRLLGYANVSHLDFVEIVHVDAEGAEVFDKEDGVDTHVRIRDDIDPHVFRLIQGIEFNNAGGIAKIVLPDRLKATLAAAEMLGMKRDASQGMSDMASAMVQFMDNIAASNEAQPLLPAEAERLAGPD
jgi:hypothetical protein